MKKFLAIILIITSAITAAAENYMPEFHGVVRARYEYDFDRGAGRFQVRNARLSIQGNVAPSIDYFVQADLCDRGSIKILDAYGRFRIIQGLSVRAGQYVIPFGVEAFRAPKNYIFANRSFVAKEIMSTRAVGASVAFDIPHTPLTLEAGAFNPSTIGDHTGWHKSYEYASKLTYRVGECSISASYASIKPYELRSNLVDGAVVWDDARHWLVGGEYIFQRFAPSVVPDVHCSVGFVDWHMPVKSGVFNQWSIQGRYDGISRRTLPSDISIFEPTTHRITIGSTLTYAYKMLHADVRLNFERRFRTDLPAADHLVAEMVVRF